MKRLKKLTKKERKQLYDNLVIRYGPALEEFNRTVSQMAEEQNHFALMWFSKSIQNILQDVTKDMKNVNMNDLRVDLTKIGNA